MPSTCAELCTLQENTETTLVVYLYQTLRLSPSRNRRLRQTYRLLLGALNWPSKHKEPLGKSWEIYFKTCPTINWPLSLVSLQWHHITKTRLYNLNPVVNKGQETKRDIKQIQWGKKEQSFNNWSWAAENPHIKEWIYIPKFTKYIKVNS